MSESDKKEIIAAMLHEMAAFELQHLCGTADSFWANERATYLKKRAEEILKS